MSYGCAIAQPVGDVCTRCLYHADCATAVRRGRAGGGNGRPREYRDVLVPGQVFSTIQLRALTGKSSNRVRAWCWQRMKAGELELVGSQTEATNRYVRQVNVYPYVGFGGVSSSRDGITALENKSHKIRESGTTVVVPPLEDET